jgi:hypothetical protein
MRDAEIGENEGSRVVGRMRDAEIWENEGCRDMEE